MNVQDRHQSQQESDTKQPPQIGDRIADKSAPPDESTVRDWLGPKAFQHWTQLRRWIDLSYPGVRAGVALWRQETRLVPALQEDQGVLHLQPDTGCFQSRSSWGEQSEKSLRSGVISGARNWSSSTTKPAPTLTGNG